VYLRCNSYLIPLQDKTCLISAARANETRVLVEVVEAKIVRVGLRVPRADGYHGTRVVRADRVCLPVDEPDPWSQIKYCVEEQCTSTSTKCINY